MCASMHAHMEARDFVSHLKLELINLSNRAYRLALGILSAFFVSGLQEGHHAHLGVQDLNSDPHGYVASALSSKPSPRM